MKQETTLYLAKARLCLASARTILAIGLGNDAGRNAYLAVFHAAQALIFERTGKVAKTHSGVRSEFARIAKSESRIDARFASVLAHTYILKEIADYETGPDAVVPLERAMLAVDEAERFVDGIAQAIA